MAAVSSKRILGLVAFLSLSSSSCSPLHWSHRISHISAQYRLHTCWVQCTPHILADCTRHYLKRISHYPDQVWRPHWGHWASWGLRIIKDYEGGRLVRMAEAGNRSWWERMGLPCLPASVPVCLPLQEEWYSCCDEGLSTYYVSRRRVFFLECIGRGESAKCWRRLTTGVGV